MLLKTINLQNFRNYKRTSFNFAAQNMIVGKNTIGKTNILESIYFLSTGNSFRAENDKDLIKTGEGFARIEAEVLCNNEKTKITTIFHVKNGHLYKKYLVNDIPRRQLDFVSYITSVLFTPQDMDIITDSPNSRRKYIDRILCQANGKYRHSLLIYEKALKNRNKMLYFIKEGKRMPSKEEFEYWDNLLIENGKTITEERDNLIAFINSSKKNTFDFEIFYDKSTITRERLDKYFDVEQKTGITLVGPQRDEFVFLFPKTERLIKEFGSRGEQRLTILQMKLLEIEFIKSQTDKNPILLLDDIFSELDSENIEKIVDILDNQQTILTTTHKEFIPKKILKKVNIIEL